MSKIKKILLIFLGIIILLLLIGLLAIRTSYVQNVIKNQVLALLSEQYKANFSIGNIYIDGFDSAKLKEVLFRDQLGDTLLYASSLNVDIGLFSLANNEIYLDQIEIQNVRSKIYEISEDTMNFSFLIPASKEEEQDPKASKWKFGVNQILIHNPSIYYKTKKQSLSFLDNYLTVSFDELDLEKRRIGIKYFSSNQLYLVNQSLAKTTSSTPFSLPDLGWDVEARQITTNNSRLIIKNTDGDSDLVNLAIKLKNTKLNDGKFNTTIEKVNVKYNDIVDIKEGRGSIAIDANTVNLVDLDVATLLDHVKLSNATYQLIANGFTAKDAQVDIGYATLKSFEQYIPDNIKLIKDINLNFNARGVTYVEDNLALQDADINYGNTIRAKGDAAVNHLNDRVQDFKIDLNSIQLNISDLDKMLLNYDLPKELKLYSNLTGSVKVNGSLDFMDVELLNLKVDKDIALKMSGWVKNITNTQNAYVNLRVQDFSAIAKKLPIPPNEKLAIDSLGKLGFNGSIVGNLNALSIRGLLNSDLGKLKTDIALKIGKGSDDLGYKGNLTLIDFAVGTLLKDKTVGKVSLDLNLDGRGTTLENINTEIEGVITNVTYNNYTYKDIAINARVAESTIDGTVSLDDKNIKLNYEGQIILRDNASIFNFDLKLDTLNTTQLGLYSQPIALSAYIHSEFELPIPINKVSKLEIRNINLSNGIKTTYVDSLMITGTKTLDTTSIAIKSTLGYLNIVGEYDLLDLPRALEGFINHHWDIDSLGTPNDIVSKNVRISGELKTLAPIALIMRDTFLQAKKVTLDVATSFDNYTCNGFVRVDSFIYSNIIMEQVNANITTEQEKLRLDMKATNSLIAGKEVKFVSLNNLIANKSLKTEFIARDGDNIPRLKFELVTTQNSDHLNMAMKDSFILNQKDWLVGAANSIKFYDDKFIIDKFAITDNNEYLTAQSLQNGEDINIAFKNFEIGQFTTLLTSEPSELSGKVNGEMDIRDLNTDLYFLANLSIIDMVYDSTSIGVLTINADANATSRQLKTNFTLVGPTNDVKGKGTYNITSKQANFDLDVISLDMIILNPFLSEIMVDSKGNLSGKVAITGTTDNPSIVGNAVFKEVTTTIVANNAKYQIDNHTITFDNTTIDIGKLEVKDDEGNKAILSGKIKHQSLKNMDLDLQMNTKKFTFLNTTSDDNPVFYGKVILDAQATLRGDPTDLEVKVIAKTLANSAITISPFAEVSAIIEEKFITYGKPEDFDNVSSEFLIKLNRLYPFDVNLVLDATKDAKFTFIVDPVSGDKIESKGSGDLIVKLKPDGSQEVYGTYKVDEGFYNFSYGDFVSKKFEVKPGGTVRFDGNPLTAILNIDAVYNVYTTTYELIKNEMSVSDSETAAAKKRTNVKVSLSLKGTLESPSITLDIAVPDLESSNLVSAIDRKLTELRNNPNDLNNQVFGLLIFDSFILSNNASTGFDNLGSNIALSSLSSLVSGQLNRFANSVVKGVDINVNVNSYESGYINGGAGGNVTEVGLQVSKQLFNDRLSLSAGGNLDINQGASSGGYSSFIGDFVLKYKLTDDGRYQVRVFSKADYDRLLNANTNRNGVSIYFNQSFDSKTNGKK